MFAHNRDNPAIQQRRRNIGIEIAVPEADAGIELDFLLLQVVFLDDFVFTHLSPYPSSTSRTPDKSMPVGVPILPKAMPLSLASHAGAPMSEQSRNSRRLSLASNPAGQ